MLVYHRKGKGKVVPVHATKTYGGGGGGGG
jgi:hypothetical protein